MPRKKTKYPLRSSKKQLTSAIKKANQKINAALNLAERKALKKILDDYKKGKTSLAKYTKNKRIIRKRKQRHNYIIKKQFLNKKSIDRKDPDLYILGGIAGSGKSEVLRKFIPPNVLTLDNDNYKKLLSKNFRSPIKKYPLAHAALLHDESDVLFNRAIKRALREKRDLTLDMTFATYEKGKALMERFKRAGYDVHLLGTQKKPHHSIVHVISRFIKKGRYVPPEVIAKKGNRINRNVIKARKLADSHKLYDTTIKGKPKLIYRSRGSHKRNYRNPRTKRAKRKK